MAEKTRPTHDVDVRRLAFLGIGLFLLIALALVVSFLVQRGLVTRQRELAGRASPLARPQLPPEPRLQTSPPVDLRAFRAQERAVLDGYGWVDRSSDIVRVPIEEAKKLVLEKGLPVAAPRPPPAAPEGSAK